ncbi:Flp family type IVb pilin [Sedimentibacter sp.]|uniref:Flp family type IVb pilin n=1 Tax=Sedimentibacter sp. TaxID=1960295 RepID=UPI0028ADF991|nr:Flp family type IVb pilin [Sedimentibacter sp.]
MKKLMNWLKNEESGQGMVEYGLIIALVAVVLIGALVALQGGLDNIFTQASDVLNDPSSAVSN